MARQSRAQRLLAQFERVLLVHADIELPEMPGVYFVASKNGTILYIGQSLNMKNRWDKGHHKALACVRSGGHFVYYQYTEEPADLEALYLEEYDPPLNNKHVRTIAE